MFPDAFLQNLAVFMLGQAVAWFYLRTGRVWIGGCMMATLWLCADWALLARFVWQGTGRSYLIPLVGMQVVAIGGAMALGFAQWRRRYSATARQRHGLFRLGSVAYLKEDLAVAATTFRRLVRCDPWDASAWLALGNVQRRRSALRSAAASYRRARAVDRRGDYGDLVTQQLARLCRGAEGPVVAMPIGGSPPVRQPERRVSG